MSEMKLIMENWNKYLLLEASELKTMGDLKKFFILTKVKKKGGPAAKKALKTMASFIPGLGAAWNIFDNASEIKDVITSLYQKDDNFQTSDALSKINVDDNISKIVDDQVELDFLGYLLEELGKLSDDTPLEDIDVTSHLKQYLAKTFNSRTVTGDK